MTFEEWYAKYWPATKAALSQTATATQRSNDQHQAMIAFAAAKDLNPTNLLDLEYLCELAERYLSEHMIEDIWQGTECSLPGQIARASWNDPRLTLDW